MTASGAIVFSLQRQRHQLDRPTSGRNQQERRRPVHQLHVEHAGGGDGLRVLHANRGREHGPVFKMAAGGQGRRTWRRAACSGIRQVAQPSPKGRWRRREVRRGNRGTGTPGSTRARDAHLIRQIQPDCGSEISSVLFGI